MGNMKLKKLSGHIPSLGIPFTNFSEIYPNECRVLVWLYLVYLFSLIVRVELKNWRKDFKK